MKCTLGTEMKEVTMVEFAAALAEPGAKESVLLFKAFDSQNYWLLTAPTREQLLADLEQAMRTHKPDVCLTFDGNDDDHPQYAITARELFIEGEDEHPWEVIHYHGDWEPFHEGFETFEDALKLWLTFVPRYMVTINAELLHELADAIKP